MPASRMMLPILDERIEARARSTREAHPWKGFGEVISLRTWMNR